MCSENGGEVSEEEQERVATSVLLLEEKGPSLQFRILPAWSLRGMLTCASSGYGTTDVLIA